MPRLSPLIRLPEPPEGLRHHPIGLNCDRYYTLDDAGQPVRCYDYTEHATWTTCEGKGWQIKDNLPEYSLEVWTYFSGWASLRDDLPPMFCTTISGSIRKRYYSRTWEVAAARHGHVLEKIRKTLTKIT